MKAVTLRQNGVEHTLMAVERDDLKEGLEIWVARENGVMNGRILQCGAKTTKSLYAIKLQGSMYPLNSLPYEGKWNLFAGYEGVPGCEYDNRFPRIFLTKEEAILVVDEVQNWIRDWEDKHGDE